MVHCVVFVVLRVLKEFQHERPQSDIRKDAMVCVREFRTEDSLTIRNVSSAWPAWLFGVMWY